MAEVESNDKVAINPALAIKADGATGDCKKEGNDSNKEENVPEFLICSPNHSIKTVNTNPFLADHNKTGKSILKPSQLSLNSSSTSKFVLKQSSFNPSSKPSSENNRDHGDKKQFNGEVLKFVPLIKTESQTLNQTDSSSTNKITVINTAAPTFIFGQNLQERVIGSESNSSDPTPSTSLTSNGTSDMLFSSAIKSETKTDTVKEKESKSLTESAREYEESRAIKRKYDEVETKTGEEEETNILSVSCKLFAFDNTTSNWQERGRGILRLNDFETGDDHIGSRLVFRTTGSLRVVLNTKIWAEMTIDKASDRSIRLTALDASGEIKVFLIMSSIEDSRQLYAQMQTRLFKEITLQKRKKSDPHDSEMK